MASWCVLNRGCASQDDTPLDTAGADTYAVGFMLLQFLIGTTDGFELLGSPGFKSVNLPPNLVAASDAYTSTIRKLTGVNAARMARFLALDIIDAPAIAASVRESGATARMTRARVRARTHSLLLAALEVGAGMRQRRGNALATQPAHSAGIEAPAGSVFCVRTTPEVAGTTFTTHSGTYFASVDATLTAAATDVAQPRQQYPFEVCTKTSAAADAACACQGTQADRDAAMIRTRAAAASKPGTDALLELLANLLSPGLAPGLLSSAHFW
jgi:hypothetical protein